MGNRDINGVNSNTYHLHRQAAPEAELRRAPHHPHHPRRRRRPHPHHRPHPRHRPRPQEGLLHPDRHHRRRLEGGGHLCVYVCVFMCVCLCVVLVVVVQHLINVKLSTCVEHV